MCAKPKGPQVCEAWQLLVRFSFTQRSNLPPLAAELELSPAQCHLLNLIGPDRPMPGAAGRRSRAMHRT
jgi:hypothetical protein